MNVYEKLMDARERFHSLELKKTGRNTFANYNYFELGDFLIPALQVFRQVGLCALPVSFSKETATMTILDAAKPEDRIVFESPMGSANLKGCHEVQNVGAVETYQRRYLWVAALEIVEHDALDATTGKDKEEGKARNEAPVRSFKHTPTDEALTIDPSRETVIKLAASLAAVKFKKGDQIGAYEEISGITDADEKLYLWQILKPESALRAFIKKHAQELRETETEPN